MMPVGAIIWLYYIRHASYLQSIYLTPLICTPGPTSNTDLKWSFGFLTHCQCKTWMSVMVVFFMPSSNVQRKEWWRYGPHASCPWWEQNAHEMVVLLRSLLEYGTRTGETLLSTSGILQSSFHVLRNTRNTRKHAETQETGKHSNYDLFTGKHRCPVADRYLLLM